MSNKLVSNGVFKQFNAGNVGFCVSYNLDLENTVLVLRFLYTGNTNMGY